MSSVEFGGVSVTLILTYLGSKGHKTRWVAAGTLIVTLSCFLRIVPHLIFGPGQDALELTIEYEHMNGSQNRNLSSGKYKLRRYMFNNSLTHSMAYGTRRFNAVFTKYSPIIPILRRINSVLRIDTYFSNIHSNIGLPSTSRPY